jgi:hypothetical protein
MTTTYHPPPVPIRTPTRRHIVTLARHDLGSTEGAR